MRAIESETEPLLLPGLSTNTVLAIANRDPDVLRTIFTKFCHFPDTILKARTRHLAQRWNGMPVSDDGQGSLGTLHAEGGAVTATLLKSEGYRLNQAGAPAR